jgi:NADPH-dependent glutamate synthase beta subunit-like oxidoreductase
MFIQNLYICKLLYLWQRPVNGGQKELTSSAAVVSKPVLQKILDADKVKYCFECGICTASCSMADMLGDYNPRALLEQVFLNPENILESDEVWLCGWCYRCQKRCPQGLKLPEVFLSIRSIAVESGQVKSLDKALEKIVKNVPLPLVTTLVCFHPERAGLKTEKVLKQIEQIRGEMLKTKKPAKMGQKVCVIGSGPAGLTVAYELGRKGYSVTVFESLPELGGMLKKCIPEYRLPRKVLSEELKFVEDLGVEVKTKTEVGKDVSIEDLEKEGFEVFFIGSGAHKSQHLKIEGCELEGVVDALDFLWSVNCGKKTNVGKNVVVIGGGNVAMDAARTARCSGAEQVTVMYRRSRDEMPANPWEVKEAEEEGVKFEFLVSPKKVLNEKGKVTGLDCLRMRLDEPDESGRRKAVPVEGSDFKRDTDMVILAIGESPNLEFLPKQFELNDDGTVWVNPVTMETSVSGFYAGGDAVSGPASVIEAIRDGKRAAESIEAHLRSGKRVRL